jgi:hypothetical protein
MSVFSLIVVLCAVAARPSSAQPAATDSVHARAIAPGVTHRRIVRGAGPWRIHVLEVDLRRPEIEVRGIRACDRLLGRERPTSIARRLREEGIDVVAVLNADFFDLRGGTGASESNVIVDGEVVHAVATTASPFDTFDNVHSQFGLTMMGKPVLDRFALVGSVQTPHGRWTLAGINESAAAGLSLHTEWSEYAAPDSGREAAEVELVEMGGGGDSLVFRVRGAPDANHDGGRSAERVVLRGAGPARDDVERLRAGDLVAVVTRFSPDRGPLFTLVGGWPRIVTAGRNVASAADSVEGTFPRFSAGRHPRSAVGISRDSLTLYLVAVDGRQATSVGMSLVELADAMLSLGAHEALNLDGGGSTALVVGESIVNTPSDTSGERPVGNVIAITRRRPGESVRAPRAVPASGEVRGCVVGRT